MRDETNLQAKDEDVDLVNTVSTKMVSSSNELIWRQSFDFDITPVSLCFVTIAVCHVFYFNLDF